MAEIIVDGPIRMTTISFNGFGSLNSFNIIFPSRLDRLLGYVEGYIVRIDDTKCTYSKYLVVERNSNTNRTRTA